MFGSGTRLSAEMPVAFTKTDIGGTFVLSNCWKCDFTTSAADWMVLGKVEDCGKAALMTMAPFVFAVSKR